jgi:hypothetical protein
MATYKTTSGDWYISLNNGLGTIYIDGNLDVTGNITYVTEIAVNDAFIIVAANNTGTVQDMGLVAQKTSNTFAGLRFDTAANAWQISSNVYGNGAPIAAYANLSLANAATTVAGSNTQVQFNQSGAFGASANLTFNYASQDLAVKGQMVLANINSTPTTVANSVSLYNNQVGAGATSLYVVGNTVPTDEVVSATRARLWAIIF